MPRDSFSAPPRRQFFRALAFACGLGVLAAAARAEGAKEYAIKAAYLYNFAKFVEWPANRFADAKSPIVIGIVGRNVFGDELEDAVRGRKVNGRDVVVIEISSEKEMRTAHLLFVAGGDEKSFTPAVGTGILTVGESPEFAELGGMVTFVPQGDKIRFTINLDAAERAGLKLSAQLLKLASAVQRKPL